MSVVKKLIPNQSNRRSRVQWYFPLKCSLLLWASMEQVRKWRHCMCVVIFECTKGFHFVPFPFSPNDAIYCQFRQRFWCQSRAAFAQIIFAVLMATAFGKMCPKCRAQCKSCSLQYALKYQQKWRWTRTTTFAPFTLCCNLCSLHTLIGEIDSYSLSTKELLD